MAKPQLSVTDSSGRKYQIEIEVSVRCPCGKRCDAGHVIDGLEPVAIHETPECQKFIDLDLPDYLAYVRTSGGALLS